MPTASAGRGARVLRPFTHGSERLPRGHRLAPDEVEAIPHQNLTSLLNQRMIELEGPSRGIGVFIVIESDREKGRYDVAEIINPKPLSRKDALALAHHK